MFLGSHKSGVPEIMGSYDPDVRVVFWTPRTKGSVSKTKVTGKYTRNSTGSFEATA